MHKIIKSDGQTITHQNKILKEQHDFYAELYSSEREVIFDLDNTTGIHANDYDRSHLNKQLTLEELHTATFTMKANKTPGLDGLPVEFYHCFWTLIANKLLELYQYSYKEGILNLTARQGLISLLPKGNRDTSRLKIGDH